MMMRAHKIEQVLRRAVTAGQPKVDPPRKFLLRWEAWSLIFERKIQKNKEMETNLMEEEYSRTRS